ncbi:MAG: phospholipid carrier-dependent glycosyltransferase [Clostridiales bacterium]|jgi:dolichyl-phosphate-mannose--protein O-mannosyl transferase|nr:phospholipid carrier-dependent glycosyltransferase [Clostridiales bacterium]
MKDLLKKPQTPLVILALIVVAYAIVTFTNLGDLHAPQTFVSTTASQRIVLDLGDNYDISRINLYVGIGDARYTFEDSYDGATWHSISTTYDEKGNSTNEATIKADYANFFAWHVARVDTSGRYLRVTAWEADAMLGEVAVYGPDGQIPIVSSTQPEVADEQQYAQRSKTDKNSTYFDEIYHARTAYEILHEIPIYETTHPPLGKLLISIGIWIFGMVPFGWRFMGALAGVIMLPVLYLIAKKLFNDAYIALLATGLLALDFMHFSLTRISTIDSYPVLFILLTFLFLIDYIKRTLSPEFDFWSRVKPLLWSGIFFGLGCASKWITLYAAFGILALIILTWVRSGGKRASVTSKEIMKHFYVCCVTFIVIPAIVYFMAYIPQMRYSLNNESPIKYVVQSQKYMYKYHSALVAEHAFSSPASTWPLIKRPLWAYMDEEASAYGNVGSIVIMGNPAIWWLGSLAMLALLIWALYKRSFVSAFIGIGFLTQYVVWLSVSRILFIYHFFASVPFIILALCFWLKRAPRWASWSMLGVSALLFVAFYPVLSGHVVSLDYAEKLVWFKSWILFAR